MEVWPPKEGRILVTSGSCVHVGTGVNGLGKVGRWKVAYLRFQKQLSWSVRDPAERAVAAGPALIPPQIQEG